jgi:hypothetical protein
VAPDQLMGLSAVTVQADADGPHDGPARCHRRVRRRMPGVIDGALTPGTWWILVAS